LLENQDNILVFDLDGTLIKNDITVEYCILHIKCKNIIGFIQIFIWFILGRDRLKDELTNRYLEHFSVDNLPFSNVIEDLGLTGVKNKIIASGSHYKIVEKISKSFFNSDKFFGSKLGFNCVGSDKAMILKNYYGDKFDYVGNSKVDIPIWKVADKCYGYNISKSTLKKAQENGIKFESYFIKEDSLKSIFKSLRPHQWIKNILIFVPLLLNMGLYNQFWILALVNTFIALSLVCSATYIINDLFDIEADREHPTKKHRAFASGRVSVLSGLKISILLFIIGLGISFAVSTNVFMIVLFYAVISILYSLLLKSYLLLDVMLLGFFYCWRVILGAEAIAIGNNIWFLSAVFLLFLSLGFGKRDIELKKNIASGTKSKNISGRAYTVHDSNLISILGVASSVMTTLVVLIYGLISDQTIFKNDLSIILITLILFYWQSRFWILVNRGNIDDDPVSFAIKDKVSIYVLICFALIAILEQLWH
jgi:4-hydroxybenzoate polyprenyltransferase